MAISIISIVDENRIWLKSHHGVPVGAMGRDPGLPPGFDPTAIGGSLGMRVVESLTRQLDGRSAAVPHTTGPGAGFDVAFPESRRSA